MSNVSVPQVRSIDDLRWQAAKVLELGVEATRLSGDISHLELGLQTVRMVYEEVLKIEANSGKLDRDYLEQVRKAIERIESIVLRHKSRSRSKL